MAIKIWGKLDKKLSRFWGLPRGKGTRYPYNEDWREDKRYGFRSKDYAEHGEGEGDPAHFKDITKLYADAEKAYKKDPESKSKKRERDDLSEAVHDWPN